MYNTTCNTILSISLLLYYLKTSTIDSMRDNSQILNGVRAYSLSVSYSSKRNTIFFENLVESRILPMEHK